jgi:hypothetical protein
LILKKAEQVTSTAVFDEWNQLLCFLTSFLFLFLFLFLDQVKMDMPGGDIVSGLVGMLGGMFGKKSAEEGGELSDEDAIRAIEGKLPSKGVVNFRFKVMDRLAN